MSIGLIGVKIGMTSIFDDDGNSIPCTVVKADDNVVTQIRTEEVDGYTAMQLATGEKKEKRTTKALQGHFGKAGTSPKRIVREFDAIDVGLGDTVGLEDLFEVGERIDVAGTSKGKGFQGVVKRHGFAGVGGRTHGQHNRQRAPGSIGAASTPSRVFKGMKMAGRTGGVRAMVKNLEVVRILPDQKAILIRGAVPGAINSYVELHKQPGSPLPERTQQEDSNDEAAE